MNQQPDNTLFSTTPAVYASFSPEARALLEGLIIVSDDLELLALVPAPRTKPMLLRVPLRRSA